MKPYPKYKPSDIQWLGDIPEHWEVKKLKYVSSIKLGKMLTPEDKGNFFLKPYLRAQNINWLKTNVEDVKEMWFSETELETFRIKHNDLLVSEGGEVGRTCIWEDELEECYIQNSVHKVSFSDAHVSKFFLYQFYYFGQTGHFDSIVNRISIAHLTGEKLKEVNFIVPPLPEQTAIAQFLDQKTAQIDTLIAQKQRLISLLKEERMAFINEILSDKSFPLKKLKYVTKAVQTGSTPPSDKTEYFNGDFDWFTPSDFKDNLTLRNSKRKLTDLAITHGLVKVYEPYSVLMIGIGATLGKIGLIEREASSNQQVNCITFTDEINPYFGAYFLNSISQDIVSMANAATLAILNQSQTKDIKIPCPSLKTQQKIVKSIETTTGKIDATLAKIVQEIELLKEYRVALISEVVTGKVSVFS